MANFLSLLVTYFFVPYLAWLSFITFLAAFGKSFGVRNLYIKALLKMFEWGKERMEKHEHEKDNEGSDDEDTTRTHNGGITEEAELIERQVELSSKGLRLAKVSPEELMHDFHMSDMMYFCKHAMESIIEDGVTQRFDAAELCSWNLLTRTHNKHEFISYRLTALWFLGCVLRYFILLPFRFTLAIVALSLMIVGTAIIGFVVPAGCTENDWMRRWAYKRLSLTAYRIMARAFSAVITFHNLENKAKPGGICVANHTSPVDIMILGCDNTYAMVGQQQGGLFGILQRAFSRGESHIWFNRFEAADRLAVSKKMAEHVHDTNKLPILIFPEGTCINNTSIMMFKKGSFETGGVIYPAAIKYDPRFADAFWNSSAGGLISHFFLIMSSWALVVQIWYLPPEYQREGETAIQFASRVKATIARQGGLVDLDWDGQLKRSLPKATMKQRQQEVYSQTLNKED